GAHLEADAVIVRADHRLSDLLLVVQGEQESDTGFERRAAVAQLVAVGVRGPARRGVPVDHVGRTGGVLGGARGGGRLPTGRVGDLDRGGGGRRRLGLRRGLGAVVLGGLRGRGLGLAALLGGALDGVELLGQRGLLVVRGEG